MKTRKKPTNTLLYGDKNLYKCSCSKINFTLNLKKIFNVGEVMHYYCFLVQGRAKIQPDSPGKGPPLLHAGRRHIKTADKCRCHGARGRFVAYSPRGEATYSCQGAQSLFG
jgi:hypothetical protein